MRIEKYVLAEENGSNLFHVFVAMVSGFLGSHGCQKMRNDNKNQKKVGEALAGSRITPNRQ
jgi:hypothetical protein